VSAVDVDAREVTDAPVVEAGAQLWRARIQDRFEPANEARETPPAPRVPEGCRPADAEQPRPAEGHRAASRAAGFGARVERLLPDALPQLRLPDQLVQCGVPAWHEVKLRLELRLAERVAARSDTAARVEKRHSGARRLEPGGGREPGQARADHHDAAAGHSAGSTRTSTPIS
jgi:hypothetical protein